MRRPTNKRRGTTTVEYAIVFPALFLLLVGMVIGASGVFRYQETAQLARKAARYASVHGEEWAKDTGNPAPTPTDIYNTAIAPNMVILDPNKLTYSVTYNTSNSAARTSSANGQVIATQNTVTVTISYQWIPEAFWKGSGITLSSTSVMPMSY